MIQAAVPHVRAGGLVVGYAYAGGRGAMPAYRAFSSAAYAGSLAQLEAAINEWMRSERPRIQQVAQSPFGLDLVISFVYDGGSATESATTEAAAVPEVFERTLEDTELDPEREEPDVLPEAELPY
jgi:pilus assembly protein TadC